MVILSSPAALLLLSCAVSLSLACESGPQTCATVEAPVCATLRMTFSNECDMESKLCDLAKAGYHFVEKRDGSCCHGPQPLIYSPTCGSDGKVYSNRWDMSYTACGNKDYVTEASPESCPDFPRDYLPRPLS